ncbi:MAG: hypothetical protein WCK96_11640 [Methylococcales bacterium]
MTFKINDTVTLEMVVSGISSDGTTITTKWTEEGMEKTVNFSKNVLKIKPQKSATEMLELAGKLNRS